MQFMLMTQRPGARSASCCHAAHAMRCKPVSWPRRLLTQQAAKADRHASATTCAAGHVTGTHAISGATGAIGMLAAVWLAQCAVATRATCTAAAGTRVRPATHAGSAVSGGDAPGAPHDQLQLLLLTRSAHAALPQCLAAHDDGPLAILRRCDVAMHADVADAQCTVQVQSPGCRHWGMRLAWLCRYACTRTLTVADMHACEVCCLNHMMPHHAHPRADTPCAAGVHAGSAWAAAH